MRSLTKNEAIAVSVCVIVVLFLFGSQFLAFTTVDEQIPDITYPNQMTTMTDSNKVAVAGDIVAVIYTGKFADGTIFDASEKHGGQPIQFQLGAGQVIKGWDQGIAGMKIGEKKSLVIPPELGYGTQAVGPIPPNSTLYFDVELVGIQSAQ